jgi:NTP pyrophosphatase (non-canonical NTP hydrolase)
MGIDFKELRAANVMRQAEWEGNEQADTAFRALEVADEAGELCGAVKKLLRAQRGIAGSTLTLQDVADEIGDTVISLDLLANELGIDLAWKELKAMETPLSPIQMTLVMDSVIGDTSFAVVQYLRNVEKKPAAAAEDLQDINAGIRRAVHWVLAMADALGVDAGQAVAAKFNKTSEKYGLRTKIRETETVAA